MAHPLVGMAIFALAGCLSTVSPGPSLFVSLFWYLSNRARSGRGIFLVSLVGLFLVTATRASWQIEDFEARYQQSRKELDGPKVCAGTFIVIQSPTLRNATKETPEALTLWTGETAKLDCEGHVVEGPLRARLYGGSPNLARGDQVATVAKLAPVRLFRNSGLPNPIPGTARRGSVLSGSAVYTERVRLGHGLFAWIDRARAKVRDRIEATYAPVVSSLGRALVLGENDLGQEDADAFQNSGLLHLLAVSGTHLVIAVYALVQGLRALLVRIGPLARRFDLPRLSAALGALLSLLYADFSGGSGSASRAAFMLCVVCGARSVGVRVKGSAALGSSLLIGLAVDPLAAFDFSFLLSALATAGLIGIGQPLGRMSDKGLLSRSPFREISMSLTATVSSTLPCAPVLAMMNGNMTLAALFANVVAGPLGEIIALPACLLHTIAGPSPAIEQGLALVGSGALVGVRAIALWSASVEVAQFEVPFPSAWRVASMICVSLFLSSLKPGFWSQLWHIQKNSLRRTSYNLRSLPIYSSISGFVVISLVALCPSTTCLTAFLPTVFCPSALCRAAAPLDLTMESEALSPPKKPFVVTALDVGQGDAFFLDFPDGTFGLVDGGGFVTNVPDTGKRVLLPYLRARGVRHLALVVLSHAHPDHMNGLVSLLEQITVGQLWIPRAPDRADGQLKTLVDRAQKGGALVRDAAHLCAAGTEAGKSKSFPFAGLTIAVFAPCVQHSPPFGENDGSLVVKMTYRARSALFTGDIEVRGEESLLALHKESLQSDLLKVPHHGSDTSSSRALLGAVSPSYAMISSGVRNRFAHPRPSTLENLSHASNARGQKTVVLRTDNLGSIAWSTDGHRQEIRSFSPPKHPAERLYL